MVPDKNGFLIVLLDLLLQYKYTSDRPLAVWVAVCSWGRAGRIQLQHPYLSPLQIQLRYTRRKRKKWEKKKGNRDSVEGKKKLKWPGNFTAACLHLRISHIHSPLSVPFIVMATSSLCSRPPPPPHRHIFPKLLTGPPFKHNFKISLIASSSRSLATLCLFGNSTHTVEKQAYSLCLNTLVHISKGKWDYFSINFILYPYPFCLMWKQEGNTQQNTEGKASPGVSLWGK